MQAIEADKLISSLPCGIFTFSSSGSVVFINDTLLNQLQYNLSELEGGSIERIFTLSTRIFYQTHFFPLLRLHKRADEIFITLLSKKKEEVPVLINAQQATHNGEVIYVCFGITVYQRKKYEQEILLAKRAAEEAMNKNEELQKVRQELEKEREALDKQITRLKYKNEELSQLSNIFTHDLQEPVRKVSVFTDVIRNDKSMLNGDEAYSLFDIIFRASRKLRKVLRSIQEYLYLNVEVIKQDTVDLNRVVIDQLSILKNKHPDIDPELSLDNLPNLKGDEEQLSILFKNLLDNCFCFKGERPLLIQITCSTITENIYSSIEGKYRYGSFAQISIQDNGIGFDPKTGGHIFRILKKLDITSEGLGMGLALCKKIVENHAGKITAASREGIGSKFVVTLPVE